MVNTDENGQGGSHLDPGSGSGGWRQPRERACWKSARLLGVLCGISLGGPACTVASDHDRYEIVSEPQVDGGGTGGDTNGSGGSGATGAAGGSGGADAGIRPGPPARVYGNFTSTGVLPSARGKNVRLKAGGFEVQRGCGESGRCVTGSFQ